MLQATVARAGARPHARGLWGGWGRCPRFLLGALGAPAVARARKLLAGGRRGQRIRCLAVGRCGFPFRCRRGRGRGLGRYGGASSRGGRGCRFASRFRQLTSEGVDDVLEGRDWSLERGDHGLLRRGGGEGGRRLGRAVAPLTPLGARAAARRRPPRYLLRVVCLRERVPALDLGALKEGGQLGDHPRSVAHRAQGARAKEGEDAGASQKGSRGLRII